MPRAIQEVTARSASQAGAHKALLGGNTDWPFAFAASDLRGRHRAGRGRQQPDGPWLSGDQDAGGQQRQLRGKADRSRPFVIGLAGSLRQKVGCIGWSPRDEEIERHGLASAGRAHRADQLQILEQDLARIAASRQQHRASNPKRTGPVAVAKPIEQRAGGIPARVPGQRTERNSGAAPRRAIATGRASGSARRAGSEHRRPRRSRVRAVPRARPSLLRRPCRSSSWMAGRRWRTWPDQARAWASTSPAASRRPRSRRPASG